MSSGPIYGEICEETGKVAGKVAETWDKWEYGSFQYGHYEPEGFRSPTTNYVEDTKAENDHWLWKHLTTAEVDKACTVLEAYCSDERAARLHEVLDARTTHVKFVYENPANANNVWAALRTLDSFGVQDVDVIMDKIQYKQGWRRNTMVAAMGAQKWLTLTQHGDSASCVATLQEQGYRIVATDLGPTAKPMSEVNWNKGKVAVVMGNELTGISDELRAAADETFFIPTKGFAESLNVSVAAAVLCTLLESAGSLVPHLEPANKARILLTWLSRSVPGALSILRREGLPVHGNSLYKPIGKFTTKP